MMMMMPSMSTDESVMEMESLEMSDMPQSRTKRRKRSSSGDEFSEVTSKGPNLKILS